MGARRSPPPPEPVAFDSDVLIWYLRGLPAAARALDEVPYSQRIIPAIVAMELVSGCRDRSEQRALRRFVEAAFGGVTLISDEISRRALMLTERHTLSHGLAPADALVASTALTLRAALLTANARDYRFVSGLRLRVFRPR
ncbi:MAG: type II toxin-antitoxin system VapC family toxin [Actinomycetota bacterium]